MTVSENYPNNEWEVSARLFGDIIYFLARSSINRDSLLFG